MKTLVADIGGTNSRLAVAITSRKDSKIELTNVAKFKNSDFKNFYNELEEILMFEVLQSVIDGHSEKTYPYMTMTPDHPGHQPGWIRPYPNNIWSDKFEGIDGWGKSGMPSMILKS